MKLMLMIPFILLTLLLPDEEQLLNRAHNSLKETNGFLMSYQNSIRFDRTHHRLSHFRIKTLGVSSI